MLQLKFLGFHFNLLEESNVAIESLGYVVIYLYISSLSCITANY